MKTVTYPFTLNDHGSRNVDMSVADNFFGYTNSRDGTPHPITQLAGGGGEFSMAAGESFASEVVLPAGKALLITRSATFGTGPSAELSINGKSIGPGASVWVKASGEINFASSTGGVFCIQSNHN